MYAREFVASRLENVGDWSSHAQLPNANNIEAKIEATTKNMFNKAEDSSLSIKDKQMIKKMIENKITPIENRTNFKNKLKEKREKKAPRNFSKLKLIP